MYIYVFERKAESVNGEVLQETGSRQQLIAPYRGGRPPTAC